MATQFGSNPVILRTREPVSPQPVNPPSQAAEAALELASKNQPRTLPLISGGRWLAGSRNVLSCALRAPQSVMGRAANRRNSRLEAHNGLMPKRLFLHHIVIVTLQPTAGLGASDGRLADAAEQGDHAPVRPLIEQRSRRQRARASTAPRRSTRRSMPTTWTSPSCCCAPARTRPPPIATASRRSISPASTATPR